MFHCRDIVRDFMYIVFWYTGNILKFEKQEIG